MNQKDEKLATSLAVLAVCVILALGLVRCLGYDFVSTRAAAQDRHPVADTVGQDLSPAVVLARVCTKEASFDGYADCPPIAAVLLRVGHGDVVRGARLYSRKVFDPSRLGRRPWIAYLRGDDTEPRDWPTNMNWANHRPHWHAMVELARNVLGERGERPEMPCEDIQHWGDRLHDAERARARGWIEVLCGPTRNSFWRVPQRGPRPAGLPAAAGSWRR